MSTTTPIDPNVVEEGWQVLVERLVVALLAEVLIQGEQGEQRGFLAETQRSLREHAHHLTNDFRQAHTQWVRPSSHERFPPGTHTMGQTRQNGVRIEIVDIRLTNAVSAQVLRHQG